MPRPAGAPFWGEQHYCLWDWDQLGGVSDIFSYTQPGHPEGIWLMNNVNSIAAADSLGEGFENGYDNYARLHEGGSWVVFSYRGASYLESTDNVAGLKVSWILRMKNTADMHFYDDYVDSSWPYGLPANDLGVTNVRAPDGAWTWFEIPASAFTIDQLMSSDGGAIRFGLVNEGGICDIDYIALRIWPTGGALGWWEPRATETRQGFPNIYEIGFPLGIAESNDYHEWDPSDDSGGTEYAAAWTEMISNASGNPNAEFNANLHGGSGTLGSTVNDYILSSLDGSQHIGKFQYNAAYLVVDLGDLSTQAPNAFFFSGTDGVDFIRRPDRHESDLFAYTEYNVYNAVPTVVSWTNNDFRVIGYKSNRDQLTPWGTGDDADGVSVDTYGYPFPIPLATGQDTPLSLPFPVGGNFVALDDISGGGPETDVTINVGLPYETRFMIACGNTGTQSRPPQADYETHPLSGSGQGAVVISAEVRLGEDPAALLKATVQFPTYRTWDPYGTRGGKLKHRLADSTWRTVGVDASGRLKIRSVDNTWWEEVKSTDAAGSVQYLHFQTRWGWKYSIPFRPVP